jgi:hypothetical protein
MRITTFFLDKILQLAAFILLGLVLGVLVWRVIDAGYFQQWRKLPIVPVKFGELAMAGRGDIYANATDGKTYRCTSWKGECWIQDQAPTDIHFAGEVTKPCNFSLPEFFFLANPPINSVSCIQARTDYGDGFSKYAYVLDRSNDVWEWSHPVSAYSSYFMMFAFPGAGLLVGLVVGIVSLRHRGRNQMHRDSSRLT